jgi:hypothetical protein
MGSVVPSYYTMHFFLNIYMGSTYGNVNTWLLFLYVSGGTLYNVYGIEFIDWIWH